MARSRRTAFPYEGDNTSDDANGTSDKRIGERKEPAPILFNGKKKNKGPVKHWFHRAFGVLGCEVLSGGLSERNESQCEQDKLWC